jgi:hypothetical protein
MFIDEHRKRLGVELIWETIEVSASAWYERAKWPPLGSLDRRRAAARADRYDPRPVAASRLSAKIG